MGKARGYESEGEGERQRERYGGQSASASGLALCLLVLVLCCAVLVLRSWELSPHPLSSKWHPAPKKVKSSANQTAGPALIGHDQGLNLIQPMSRAVLARLCQYLRSAARARYANACKTPGMPVHPMPA